jgi:four helix bundle protein
MATFERFEDIEAWKKARSLVNMVYELTGASEFGRDYGLKDQIRRAAVSVLSNIAEGFEREGNAEFCRFLGIAKGSCGEVRAQLYVAVDQRYITAEQFDVALHGAVEVSRMISGLIKYLRQAEPRDSKLRKL